MPIYRFSKDTATMVGLFGQYNLFRHTGVWTLLPTEVLQENTSLEAVASDGFPIRFLWVQGLGHVVTFAMVFRRTT